MTTRILVADDEAILRISVSDHLRNQGWQVDEAENGNQALKLIKQNRYDLLLSDIRMPELDGETLLEKSKEIAPHTEIIMMTAHGSTDTAVNCLKNGAADYIQKPFDLDDLCFRINRILEMQSIKARCVSLEQNCTQRRPLIGSSAQMQKVLSLISQVAGTDSSVLIQGESGTGKELVAAAIHYESRRANKPYIRINCAAIPAGLMESEFFGHEKGAFTGADKTSIGKFELADQGTILLDEIGDMPLDLQVKLLRVLQEREIERVGGKHPIPVNVRVLCSTAKDLAKEVEAGNFRQDLFYRLQVIPIELPALRDRNGDISELSDYFLQEFGKERGMSFTLSDDARQTLESYHFPGNVRELHNLLERVTVLAHAPKIQQWELPIELRGPGSQTSAEDGETTSLAKAVADTEKKCIRQTLKKTEGNKTEAANLLGISRKNLWEKMKLYNLQE